MHRCPQRVKLYLPVFALVLTFAVAVPAVADPVLYEPGIDPGVGFNLVSWGNFGNGATVWQNAVQSAFDAGFDEVSLSPVRFYQTSSSASNPEGSIGITSSGGAELSHIAAGIVRAKELGMRVTVNPFIEPKNGTSLFQNADSSNTWRGGYNPTPNSAEWTTFWDDYQQYIVDVATVAQANGADAVTVGTELRALELNSGNNAKWNSVINAVDGVFTGQIGYASNWDSYNSANTANAIWDNPAVDFLGIDSYFMGMLSSGQANDSGDYPNIDFITQVENAWNNKLDNEILPYAAARQGGTGLPVVFTEIGYLPYNGTSVTPQNASGTLDADEQNMTFEGFMRALDGRRASGEFLAAHIWQWDMQGSSGSQWNINPIGGNQPTNQQTAQWLSSFVYGTNSDPGDPPPPPPASARQVLYSFESGLNGFFYPNYESQPDSTLAQATVTGATDGTHSLAVTKPTAPWTWDGRVQMSGEQLLALQAALADGADNYVLEMDITYVASSLPANLSSLNMHLSMETNLDGWNQVDGPFAAIGSPANQTFNLEIPLSSFDLSSGISSANFHFGFQGNFTGNATIYIDNIALVNLFPDNADFNGDGDVDGADFLAWQRGFGMMGSASLAQGDANGDGDVNELDLAIWQQQYGTTSELAATVQVPEPSAFAVAIFALLAAGGSRRWH